MCTEIFEIEYSGNVRIVLCIEQRVIFLKIQERTQSQRCEFQHKVINEFRCGIYRSVTTSHIQNYVL